MILKSLTSIFDIFYVHVLQELFDFNFVFSLCFHFIPPRTVLNGKLNFVHEETRILMGTLKQALSNFPTPFFVGKFKLGQKVFNFKIDKLRSYQSLFVKLSKVILEVLS